MNFGRSIHRVAALFFMSSVLVPVAAAQLAPYDYQVLVAFERPPAVPGPVTFGSDGALYGTTSSGGTLDAGVVFRIDPGTGAYTLLHDFKTPTQGLSPQGGVVEGPDGLLYGTTKDGGQWAYGAVFRMGKDGSAFQVLHSFNNQNGRGPQAALHVGSDGWLYGSTLWGGAHGLGVLFRVDPLGRYGIVRHCNTTDCHQAYDVVTTAGALYGASFSGGAADLGSIFKIDPDGTFTELRTFAEEDGTHVDALTLGLDGALYGLTRAGGAHGTGTIFRFDPRTSAFRKLYDLSGFNFAYGKLTTGADGALYGLADGGFFGNGVIFKATTDGAYFRTIHDLHPNDGDNPIGSFAVGADGRLYGATLAGGRGGRGVVFRVRPDGSGGYEKLTEFDARDGFSPEAGVVQGADGALYGTATLGGAKASGIVYRVQPDGSGFQSLCEFGGADGATPIAGVIQARDGALYGTTARGGTGDKGVVFRADALGGGCTKLHDFSGADGVNPHAGLVQADDDRLYGVTVFGGAFNGGVIFSLGTDGVGFRNVHELASHTGDRSGGALARSALIQGRDGALYGTAGAGGTNDGGVLFKLGTDGGGFVKLQDFNVTTGIQPRGPITQGRDGALYGALRLRGTRNCGMLYRVRTDGAGFATTFFDCYSGRRAPLSLHEGHDGLFYGTAEGDNLVGDGIVFAADPQTGARTTLHRFQSFGGGLFPIGGVIQGRDGALYGTMRDGGPRGGGVLFRLAPVEDAD
jgi:uncharacterized repeat protein (TIGR03803 family)